MSEQTFSPGIEHYPTLPERGAHGWNVHPQGAWIFGAEWHS